MLQEMRALRYLHAHGLASMSAVKLLGSFMHAGHLCLVLERLHGSLLDYLSHSSTLPSAVQLTNLRQIAFQLLVMLGPPRMLCLNPASTQPQPVMTYFAHPGLTPLDICRSCCFVASLRMSPLLSISFAWGAPAGLKLRLLQCRVLWRWCMHMVWCMRT